MIPASRYVLFNCRTRRRVHPRPADESLTGVIGVMTSAEASYHDLRKPGPDARSGPDSAVAATAAIRHDSRPGTSASAAKSRHGLSGAAGVIFGCAFDGMTRLRVKLRSSAELSGLQWRAARVAKAAKSSRFRSSSHLYRLKR